MAGRRAMTEACSRTRGASCATARDTGGVGHGQHRRPCSAGRDPRRAQGPAALPEDVTVHLDAGYDYRPCREALEERGLHGQVAHRGEPAPIQVGKRWVVERTNSWLSLDPPSGWGPPGRRDRRMPP